MESVMVLEVLVNGIEVDNPGVFATTDNTVVTIDPEDSHTYTIGYVVTEEYLVGEVLTSTYPKDTIQIKANPTVSRP